MCAEPHEHRAQRARPIREREQALRDVLAFAIRFPPDPVTLQECRLVCGCVVVSSDYFKQFVSGLRNLVGGRFRGFETLLDRARREAILRMHADALAIELASEVPPMNFHSQLLAQTEEARRGLVGAPIIQGCLRGEVSLPSYLAFLREAYHHVRHTVPLLRACKAALPPRLHWLHDALDEYIEEEAGHDEWILDDIAACGGDAEAVRHGRPGHATEVMVAYAYDTIARGNPVGFFGMVLVLEGTSVALATRAAETIETSLGLPRNAFTYLRSHGDLDVEHTGFYERLMNQLDDEDDRRAVVHAAKRFYKLYGDVFRTLREGRELAPRDVVQEAA